MAFRAIIKGTKIFLWAAQLNETVRKLFEFEDYYTNIPVTGVIPKTSIQKYFRVKKQNKNTAKLMDGSRAGVSPEHKHVAKELKEAFEAGIPIFLILKKEYKCPYKAIRFYSECELCNMSAFPVNRNVNLTEYFDNCRIEAPYQDGNHLWHIDVAFTRKDGQCLWIEIWYTHETRGLKMLQGRAILELDIRDGNCLKKDDSSIRITEGRNAQLYGLEYLTGLFADEGIAGCQRKAAIEEQRKVELEKIKKSIEDEQKDLERGNVLDLKLMFGSCTGYTVKEIYTMPRIPKGKKSGKDYCKWLVSESKRRAIFMQPELTLSEKDLEDLSALFPEI